MGQSERPHLRNRVPVLFIFRTNLLYVFVGESYSMSHEFNDSIHRTRAFVLDTYPGFVLFTTL